MLHTPGLALQPSQETVHEKHNLVLFYLPYCPYSQKVIRHLKEIHKSVPLRNLANDPEGKKELREKGGKMQVPCLFIDGKPLYESDAIIQWLDEHQKMLENQD